MRQGTKGQSLGAQCKASFNEADTERVGVLWSIGEEALNEPPSLGCFRPARGLVE